MGLPQAGEVFDNYKVLKVLGEGGMAQVFLAEDIKLSRKVALKFLGNGGSQKIDAKILRRFENEAKILASLNHPNIVNIYTFGIYSGVSYLAMEYVEGVTLSRVIEKKSFGVTDSINAIKQIITGLQQAHEKGILHRDIKPANLLVGTNNQIKIVDFGISKSILEDDQNLTKENHFIGTLNYMAPEILKGHLPTPPSDLFSTGIVFYELLTGKNPFIQATKIETIDMIRNEQLTLPNDIGRLIPHELQSIIAKLVAKEKENRYQSSLEALKDLEKINDHNLPDFHGVSLRPEVIVTNREENRLYLLQRGYSEQEIGIIIKLAANLVELNNSSNGLQGNQTFDLSQGSESRAIHINRDNLNLAIESFSTSNLETRVISHPETEATFVHDSSKLKPSVPFPLFKPKFLLKWTITVGFIFLNFLVFSKNLSKTEFNSGAFKKITRLLENKYSEIGKIDQGASNVNVVKKQIEESARRTLSSIPAGIKKPLPEGTVLKYKITKFNAVNGKYLINQVDTIKINKIRGNTMYAYYRRGKNGLWSTQHISSNAFLPPLRWFSKKLFNIAVTPQGNYDQIYPLHIGKKANFTYKTLQAGGAFKVSDRSCEVMETIKEEIAGRNQDWFSITCTTQTDHNRERGTFIYSPEWNLVVKKTIIEESPKAKYEESIILESIVIPQENPTTNSQ